MSQNVPTLVCISIESKKSVSSQPLSHKLKKLFLVSKIQPSNFIGCFDFKKNWNCKKLNLQILFAIVLYYNSSWILLLDPSWNWGLDLDSCTLKGFVIDISSPTYSTCFVQCTSILIYIFRTLYLCFWPFWQIYWKNPAQKRRHKRYISQHQIAKPCILYIEKRTKNDS